MGAVHLVSLSLVHEAEEFKHLEIPSIFFEQRQLLIMSNSSNQTPPARSGGLSLYANLLDPDSVTSSATVSKGPVVFKQAESTDDASAKKPSIDPGSYDSDGARVSSAC